MHFSGDESVTLAGGRAKFVTEVSVDSNGNCVWSGPATFKANCELKINEWPFDSQSCELGFGSFTYGINRMNIKLFQDTKGGGQFTSKYPVYYKSLILLFALTQTPSCTVLPSFV